MKSSTDKPLATGALPAGVTRIAVAVVVVLTVPLGLACGLAAGAVHLVSANASNTEPAELIAVFVADEGAQLTTFVD